MNENINTIQKIGNWISRLLIGNIPEMIARIDERTLIMQEDIKILKVEMKEVKTDVAELKVKVNIMFPRIDVLWENRFSPAHSPRRLNELGINILNKSGIKEIVDEKKEELLRNVRAEAPKNEYDAELIILSAVKNLPTRYPEIIDRLKPGAFKTGADIDSVLFVGGIYLRDIIFPNLGFSLEESEEPSTPQ